MEYTGGAGHHATMQAAKIRQRYHQILGVSPNATPGEVKAAYRALAKRFHPDRLRNPDIARKAEEKLKEINAAWSEYSKSLQQHHARGERRAPRPTQTAPPPSWRTATFRQAEPTDWAEDGTDGDGTGRQPAARTNRDRFRAERRAAIRDRQERERRSRERAQQVRRERVEEIHERHTREHERIRTVLQATLAGIATFIGACLLLLLIAFYFYAQH